MYILVTTKVVRIYRYGNLTTQCRYMEYVPGTEHYRNELVRAGSTALLSTLIFCCTVRSQNTHRVVSW